MSIMIPTGNMIKHMQFQSAGVKVRTFNSAKDESINFKQYSLMSMQMPGIRFRNDSMDYLLTKFIFDFCDLNQTMDSDSPPIGIIKCKLSYSVLPPIDLRGYENNNVWEFTKDEQFIMPTLVESDLSTPTHAAYFLMAFNRNSDRTFFASGHDGYILGQVFFKKYNF